MFKVAASFLIPAALLGYPLLIYFGNGDRAGLLFAGGFAALLVWQSLSHQPVVWARLLAAAVVLAGMLWLPEFTALMLPAFIPAGLMLVFYDTLKTVPLIERFARLDFPDGVPPELAHHCRQATWAWVLLFAFHIATCLGLSLWGKTLAWTLYNGLIIYLLIGLLIVGEHVWRRIRFPQLQFSSFGRTIGLIVRHGARIWRGESAA